MRLRSGAEVRVRVAGVFEIRDGLIAAWRDYFDLGAVRGRTDSGPSRVPPPGPSEDERRAAIRGCGARFRESARAGVPAPGAGRGNAP
ncbi:limonene-1,2-epoxide hydrolase family protein [Streptomyces sp. CA-181903]|uniref:limonene-1,2-epoxide hydrolase family protein n=1 Tax=Streptomyces sp. CA-181903 TaxID=3240055 RepID=UPI003D91D8B4